jgi:hypothetical protein
LTTRFARVTAWSSSEYLTFTLGDTAMTDQRMALLTRLEQAAGSTEPDVVREALRWAIEDLMEADVTERLGAGPHERTPDRLGQRNGHRPRLLDCGLGPLRGADTESGAVHSLCSADGASSRAAA